MVRLSPKVAIIILNYKGWKDTLECLESTYQIEYPRYDVIVLDNGSKDDSAEKLREYAQGRIKVESKFFEYNPKNKPLRVAEYKREHVDSCGVRHNWQDTLPSDRKLVIIRNEKNLGFAEGNNIGIRYALKILGSDYVFSL